MEMCMCALMCKGFLHSREPMRISRAPSCLSPLL